MRDAAPAGMLERVGARVVLAGTVLLFVPGLLDPFAAPKCALVILVGLPAIAWVPFALGFGRRWRRGNRPSVVVLDVAVAAWALAAGISTLAGVSPRLSLAGELQHREGLLTVLGLAGLYATARHAHTDRAHVHTTVTVLLGAAAVAAGYALAQMLGHDPLKWADTARYVAGGRALLRPFATLGNPILLGAVLAPALGIAAARLASRDGAPWVHGALCALLSTVLVATLSRGAWIAGAGALLAALAGVARDPATRSPRRLLVTVMATVLPPVFAGVWLLRGAVGARMGENVVGSGTSTLLRGEIAGAAMALWRGHLVAGTGPDTFGLMFPRVEHPAYGGGLWYALPQHAHSAVLQVLATMGVLGAVAGLGWLSALVIGMRAEEPGTRRARLEIVVALLALAVYGVTNEVGIAGAAMFVVLSAIAVPLRREDVPTLAAGPWFSAIAMVAVVTLAVPQFRALAAAGRARESLARSVGVPADRRVGLEAAAAADAGAAAKEAPDEDELWRLASEAQRALARDALRQGDRPAAARAATQAESCARRATLLEPLRARNREALGNALALRAQAAGASADSAGILAASDTAFAEARRLAPRDALVLIDEARAGIDLRRPDRASEAAGRLVQLYPEAAIGHSLLAAAALLERAPARAREQLRVALASRWSVPHGPEWQAAVDALGVLDADTANAKGIPPKHHRH